MKPNKSRHTQGTNSDTADQDVCSDGYVKDAHQRQGSEFTLTKLKHNIGVPNPIQRIQRLEARSKAPKVLIWSYPHATEGLFFCVLHAATCSTGLAFLLESCQLQSQKATVEAPCVVTCRSGDQLLESTAFSGLRDRDHCSRGETV